MNEARVMAFFLCIVVPIAMALICESPLVAQEPPRDTGQTAPKPHAMSPSGAALSWDSDRVRAIAHRIEDEKYAKISPNDLYTATESDFSDALAKKFSKAELHQLAASFDSFPLKWDDWTRYQNLLHEALIDTFLRAGDREGLVTLLSLRCLREASMHTDIEWLLVNAGAKLKDPILVLGEAYSKSRSTESRREIASAVRRGFGGLGITGRDDAEVVANAMAWYRTHHDEVVFNFNYYQNFMESRVGGDQYQKNPLFVRKTKAETPHAPIRKKDFGRTSARIPSEFRKPGSKPGSGLQYQLLEGKGQGVSDW